ncbi:WD40 repeat-like protein [Rickenella mellea]|uniref:WD40 repeat-like protein n=1 Tax=Rickenella mellea TaxID=50990 RepID=A0A4Y7QBJ0_9AGAM|nr:WD40 repeat-like protein [Rickenella mellea]
MGHSDSEEEGDVIEDLEFDVRSSEADDAEEDDILDAEGEGDDKDEDNNESMSEDSDEDGDDDDDDEDEEAPKSAAPSQEQPIPTQAPSASPNKPSTPPLRERSLSPARARRTKLIPPPRKPKSYTVEAICAIAHPVPTHALAASMCMSHLLTGSDDGYIRNYDVFAAVNGKVFLTAPQRHHCGVVEGTMKAGHLRTWWENPADPNTVFDPVAEVTVSPVYSLLMQADALWALAGTQHGHINLFTVRHEPGRFITSLHGHRGPVSSLSMAHDEKSFFSASWDGDTLNWDLNTGQVIRKFYSHGAQVAIVAVRPLSNWVPPPPQQYSSANETSHSAALAETNDDTKSEASYDPLFDDEPPAEESGSTQAYFPSQTTVQISQTPTQTTSRSSLFPPRGPRLLDPTSYADFSPDVLLTASIDGQVVLWDRRVNSPDRGVGRLETSDKTPPWCMSACWSADGGQVYAGRRNGTVDVWDTRQFGRASGGTPRLLKTLRNPISSGAVSCVVAFPDGQHVACASNDNIRLWNAGESAEVRSGVQFKIIPGHHGGQVSQMIVDPASRFMVSASSNRGWHGDSTKTILVHDIKPVM